VIIRLLVKGNARKIKVKLDIIGKTARVFASSLLIEAGLWQKPEN
jgi:hypothetical protein